MSNTNTTQLDTDLLKIIETKSQANDFFEFLNILNEKTYKTEKISEETLKLVIKNLNKQKNDTDVPQWSLYVAKKIGKDFSVNHVREVLKEMEKDVSKAELIKIEISFNPSQSFCHEIYNILAQGGIKNFLLDIEVNKELLGGAKFFIKGKYIDLTLKNTINNYLRKTDAIKRYL